MISDKGLAFTEGHEGFVSRAYRCSAGVLTLGFGFTNRSQIAVTMLGKIAQGSTITRERARQVLRETFRLEYGPPVDRAMPGAQQHELDAGYSYCFNCGPGAMKDQWVRLFQAGNRRAAADRLKTSRATANGKPLAGLQRRRREEAALLLDGVYHGVSGAVARTRSAGWTLEQIQFAQKMLNTLGYKAGTVDGVIGPRTTAAVRRYQAAHPDLVVDGIMGPATFAQLQREADLRKKAAGAVVGGSAGAGAGVGAGEAAPEPVVLPDGTPVEAIDLGFWGDVLVGVSITAAVAVLAWLAWRYRGEIRRWLNSL